MTIPGTLRIRSNLTRPKATNKNHPLYRSGAEGFFYFWFTGRGRLLQQTAIAPDARGHIPHRVFSEACQRAFKPPLNAYCFLYIPPNETTHITGKYILYRIMRFKAIFRRFEGHRFVRGITIWVRPVFLNLGSPASSQKHLRPFKKEEPPRKAVRYGSIGSLS